MGFDYGRGRIGIALAHRTTQYASPLQTLEVGRGIDWDSIGQLIETWQPDLLVVGLPLNEDGSEHEVTAEAKRFARRLEGRFNLPYRLVDERLSSHEASARLTGAHSPSRRGRRRTRLTLDSAAACLILETWLSLEATDR
jgi:putative Holliday junction resolvase